MNNENNKQLFSSTQRRWALIREKQSHSKIGFLIEKLYKYNVFRKPCLSLVKKIEGGVFFSITIRDILKKYHDVKIGRYTYGSCMKPGGLPKGTIIGSYCSIASEFKIFRRNHPLNTLSQHPFFYNHQLGLIAGDSIISDAENPLVIGSDVWIGDSVTILPGCKKIGNGSVIGSGSVVTKDVTEYEIVAGNPAKKIKNRYDLETIKSIKETKWWEKSLVELLEYEHLLFNEVNPANIDKHLK